MINSCQENQQDTLKVNRSLLKDTTKVGSDSLHTSKHHFSSDSVKQVRKSVRITSVAAIADTTSVCKRNSISDVTFYDSTNIVKQISPGTPDRFPYIFIEINRLKEAEAKAILVSHLKPGDMIPEKPLHGDWVILIILAAAYLLALIRATSKSFIPDITRFFLFRGINDPSSRDISGLFHWQTTILNLISFSVIALFFSLLLAFYGIVPATVPVFSVWLISLGIIIATVTLRHIVCTITGIIGGISDVFSEYLVGVYQSYRYSSLILFVVIVLLTYTLLLPVKICFLAGLFSFGLMYLIRVSRLFIIFINRNISIFYLILYLCALEVLPVLISVKYFTGLG